MGQPYIGEIRIFAGNFAPAGWAFCSGQILPISQYEALFNLIGTTYGGDGQSTFALPNLQSRLPMHVGIGPNGQTHTLGETGGAESVTLTVQQIPAHSHVASASNNQGAASSPSNGFWAESALNAYSATAGTFNTPMDPHAIAPAGGSQPHDNMSPFLCVSFIISLFGVFPSQN